MTATEAANDDAFKPAPVRRLTLNAGAIRMTRAQEATKNDEIWLGSAYDESGEDIQVVLRICGAMPTAAELVCAVVGRALGLPVPEPFLVRTAPDSFPGSRFARPAPALRFASHNVGGETFQQLLSARSDYAQRLLERWKHFLPVTVFDEWMANPDRNLGNILYVAGSLYLIDHAEAFGSSERQLFGLADLTAQRFANILGDILVKVSTPRQKATRLEDAKRWIHDRAGALPLADALEAAGLVHVLNDETRRELLDFVRSRLDLTHSLLCHRFGIPQLSLHAARQDRASLENERSSSSPPA